MSEEEIVVLSRQFTFLGSSSDFGSGSEGNQKGASLPPPLSIPVLYISLPPPFLIPCGGGRGATEQNCAIRWRCLKKMQLKEINQLTTDIL